MNGIWRFDLAARAHWSSPRGAGRYRGSAARGGVPARGRPGEQPGKPWMAQCALGYDCPIPSPARRGFCEKTQQQIAKSREKYTVKKSGANHSPTKRTALARSALTRLTASFRLAILSSHGGGTDKDQQMIGRAHSRPLSATLTLLLCLVPTLALAGPAIATGHDTSELSPYTYKDANDPYWPHGYLIRQHHAIDWLTGTCASHTSNSGVRAVKFEKVRYRFQKPEGGPGRVRNVRGIMEVTGWPITCNETLAPTRTRSFTRNNGGWLSGWMYNTTLTEWAPSNWGPYIEKPPGWEYYMESSLTTEIYRNSLRTHTQHCTHVGVYWNGGRGARKSC